MHVADGGLEVSDRLRARASEFVISGSAAQEIAVPSQSPIPFTWEMSSAGTDCTFSRMMGTFSSRTAIISGSEVA